MMVQQITQGIRISVKTSFEGTFIKDGKLQYAFAYAVSIENESDDTVQLTSRFWEIKDSLNQTIIVQGEGVVGKQPILYPGEKHSYTSGCLLFSPFGAMKGYYTMISFKSSHKFTPKIPLFSLAATFAIN